MCGVVDGLRDNLPFFCFLSERKNRPRHACTGSSTTSDVDVGQKADEDQDKSNVQVANTIMIADDWHCFCIR